MKVKYQNTVEYKVKQRIKKLQSNAILRSEVADLGSPREISRALKKLKEKARCIPIPHWKNYRMLFQSELAN